VKSSEVGGLVHGWMLGHRFSWRMLRRHGICEALVDVLIRPDEVVDEVVLVCRVVAPFVVLVCFLYFLGLQLFLLVLLSLLRG
jgi:hypothetical protein